jgi:hypothetical protein
MTPKKAETGDHGDWVDEDDPAVGEGRGYQNQVPEEDFE